MNFVNAAVGTVFDAIQSVAGMLVNHDSQQPPHFDVIPLSDPGIAANVHTPGSPGASYSRNNIGPPLKVQTISFTEGQASTPRPPVQAYINQKYGGQKHRAFGEAGTDKYFAHSVPLPNGVFSVSVALDITNERPGFASNDGLSVGVLFDGARWGARLNDLGLASGQRGWISIDLDRPSVDGSGPVVRGVAAHNVLDVAVQDDSIVHNMIVAIEVPE